jgi:hypothetical protein
VTSPWIGMPAIAGVTNLYTMLKDLNAKLNVTQQNKESFTTIPDPLLPYISYGNHEEWEIESRFYNHTRWKSLQSHIHTPVSSGVTMSYRIRFTLASLDKGGLQSALRKELGDTRVAAPATSTDLTRARQEIRKIDLKISDLQTRTDDLRKQFPDREHRSRQVQAELIQLRDAIMPLKLDKARYADTLNQAKVFIRAQQRDEEIKKLCRRKFISNFTFSFVEPMHISTGVSGKGIIDIETVKSLQQDARIGINFLWNEEQLLGRGHTWAGTLQWWVGPDGQPCYSGTGKFHQRFQEYHVRVR